MLDALMVSRLMELADTLYDLPEDRVVHRSRRDLAQAGFTEQAGEPKFNMSFLKFNSTECGTVCCALGWGNMMFGKDFCEGWPLPHAWLFAGKWASFISSGGDTGSAAAHRIWFWISRRCVIDDITRDGPFGRDESFWTAFALRYPIDECRATAQAYLDSLEVGEVESDRA